MRLAVIVTGLGFGDEGKGSVVDWVVRKTGATLVVRHGGGAQAAHNVVDKLPYYGTKCVEHTFAQIGAGAFAGAATFLGPEMVVDPLALLTEGKVLSRTLGRDALDAVTVDPRCLLVTPWHRAATRLRELARGEARHGSTGVGVGEVARQVERSSSHIFTTPMLRWGDLWGSIDATIAKAERVRNEIQVALARDGVTPAAVPGLAASWSLMNTPPGEWVLRAICAATATQTHEWGVDSELMRAHEVAVFEGAQGVLLDERWGFHPYTTWSDCTSVPAERILNLAGYDGRVYKLGVLRAFMTRHGPGPFPSEVSVPPPTWTKGEHNAHGDWQGAFRYGFFDAVLARYALGVNKVDGLALTCLDRLSDPFQLVTAYEDLREAPGEETIRMIMSGGALEAQELLTYEMRHYAPVTERYDKADPTQVVERELRVPVVLASHGPTAGAKRWHVDTWNSLAKEPISQ